jgi:hypothetical protein
VRKHRLAAQAQSHEPESGKPDGTSRDDVVRRPVHSRRAGGYLFRKLFVFPAISLLLVITLWAVFRACLQATRQQPVTPSKGQDFGKLIAVSRRIKKPRRRERDFRTKLAGDFDADRMSFGTEVIYAAHSGYFLVYCVHSRQHGMVGRPFNACQPPA